jgi:hypothetical protein
LEKGFHDPLEHSGVSCHGVDLLNICLIPSNELRVNSCAKSLKRNYFLLHTVDGVRCPCTGCASIRASCRDLGNIWHKWLASLNLRNIGRVSTTEREREPITGSHSRRCMHLLRLYTVDSCGMQDFDQSILPFIAQCTL